MRLGMLAPCPGHRLALPFAEERLDPGDLAAHLTEPRRVLQLSAGALKAQIEDFLAQRIELIAQLVRRAGAQIGGLYGLHGALSSPARTIKRVVTGSLAAASSNASRATSWGKEIFN